MLRVKNKKFSCKYDIRVGLNKDLSQERVIDSTVDIDKDIHVLVDNKNGDLKEAMETVEENALEN